MPNGDKISKVPAAVSSTPQTALWPVPVIEPSVLSKPVQTREEEAGAFEQYVEQEALRAWPGATGANLETVKNAVRAKVAATKRETKILQTQAVNKTLDDIPNDWFKSTAGLNNNPLFEGMRAQMVKRAEQPFIRKDNAVIADIFQPVTKKLGFNTPGSTEANIQDLETDVATLVKSGMSPAEAKRKVEDRMVQTIFGEGAILPNYFDDKGEPTRELKRKVYEIAGGDPSKFKKATEDLLTWEYGKVTGQQNLAEKQSEEFQTWLSQGSTAPAYWLYRAGVGAQGAINAVSQTIAGLESVYSGQSYSKGMSRMVERQKAVQPASATFSRTIQPLDGDTWEKSKTAYLNALMTTAAQSTGEFVTGALMAGGIGGGTSIAARGLGAAAKSASRGALVAGIERESLAFAGSSGIAPLANTTLNTIYTTTARVLKSAPATAVARYADNMINTTASMGMLTYNRYLEDLLDKGYSDAEAESKAAQRTLANLSIESLVNPFSAHTTRALKGNLATRIMKGGAESASRLRGVGRTLATGLSEGGEEVMQGLTDALLDYKDGVERGEIPADQRFDLSGALKKSFHEGLVGFVSGAMLGSRHSFSRALSTPQADAIALAIEDPGKFNTDIQTNIDKGRISPTQAAKTKAFLGTITPRADQLIKAGTAPNMAVKMSIEEARLKEVGSALTTLAQKKFETVEATDANGQPVAERVYQDLKGNYTLSEDQHTALMLNLQMKGLQSSNVLTKLKEGTYIGSRVVSGEEMAAMSERFTPAQSLDIGQATKIIQNGPYVAETVSLDQFTADPQVKAYMDEYKKVYDMGRIPELNKEYVQIRARYPQEAEMPPEVADRLKTLDSEIEAELTRTQDLLQQAEGGVPVTTATGVEFFRPQNSNPIVLDEAGNIVDGKKRVAYWLSNNPNASVEAVRPVTTTQVNQMVNEEYDNSVGTDSPVTEGLPAEQADLLNKAKSVFDSAVAAPQIDATDDTDAWQREQADMDPLSRGYYAAAQYLFDNGVSGKDATEMLKRMTNNAVGGVLPDFFAASVARHMQEGNRMDLSGFPIEEVAVSEKAKEVPPTSRWSDRTLKRLLSRLQNAFGDEVTLKLLSQQEANQLLASQGYSFPIEKTPVAWYNPATKEILLNAEVATPASVIHEAGHLWVQWSKDNAFKIFQRGRKLAADTDAYRYVVAFMADPNTAVPTGLTPEDAAMWRDYAATFEGRANVTDRIAEEILAQTIESEGQKMILSPKSGFHKWLDELFRALKDVTGFNKLTPTKFANLTLKDFSKVAVAEIFGNRTLSSGIYTSRPNGKPDRSGLTPLQKIAANMTPESPAQLVRQFFIGGGVTSRGRVHPDVIESVLGKGKNPDGSTKIPGEQKARAQLKSKNSTITSIDGFAEYLIEDLPEEMQRVWPLSEVREAAEEAISSFTSFDAFAEEIIGKNSEQQVVIETPKAPSLRTVAEVEQALKGADISALIEAVGVKANWDMLGEGDLLSGNDPSLAYVQRRLPEWNRASQRNEIDPDSPLTVDITRGVFGGIDDTGVVKAVDRNGVEVAHIVLADNGGIEHVAVAPEFRGRGLGRRMFDVLRSRNANVDLVKTEMRSSSFENAFGRLVVAEAYVSSMERGEISDFTNNTEKVIEDNLKPKGPVTWDSSTGELVSAVSDVSGEMPFQLPVGESVAEQDASIEQPDPSEEVRFALNSNAASAQQAPANTATVSSPFIQSDTTSAMPIREGMWGTVRDWVATNFGGMYGNTESLKRAIETKDGVEGVYMAQVKKLRDQAVSTIKELKNQGKLPANMSTDRMFSEVFIKSLTNEVDPKTGVAYKNMMPASLQNVATAMQNYIALLGDDLAKNGWTPIALAQEIARNRGSYLTRSFKAFQVGPRTVMGVENPLIGRRKKWIKRIPEAVKQAAQQAVTKEVFGGAVDPSVLKEFKRLKTLDPRLEVLHSNLGGHASIDQQIFAVKALPQTADTKRQIADLERTKRQEGSTEAVLTRISELPTDQQEPYKLLLAAAETKADQYLKDLVDTESKGTTVLTAAGSRMPVKEFQARKDLPQWLRDYLGEVDDPLDAFMATTSKLIRAKATMQMLDNVKQVGLASGDILLPKSVNVPEGYVRVGEQKDDASEVFTASGALNGYYVHPRLYKAMFNTPYAGTWYYKYITSPMKIGKVVLSPVGIAKNFGGNNSFLLMNGTWSNFMYLAAVKPKQSAEMFSEVKKDPKAYLANLYETGVLFGVASSMFADETRKMLGEVGNDQTIKDAFRGNPLGAMIDLARAREFGQAAKTGADAAAKGLGFTYKWANRLFASGDIIPKLMSFDINRQTFALQVYGKNFSSLEPWQQQAINNAAASHVKNTMPTTSRINANTMTAQRTIPFVGGFASFMYESFRNFGNNVQNALRFNKSFDGIQFYPDAAANEAAVKKLTANTATATIVGMTFWSNIALTAFGVLGLLGSGDDKENEEQLEKLYIGDPRPNLGYQAAKQLKYGDKVTLEEAVRMFSPDWAKNSMLIITKNEDGTFEVVDRGSYEPFNALTSIGRGMIYDGVPGAAEALWEGTVNPVFGPEMTANSIVHLLLNKDPRSQKGEALINYDRDPGVITAKVANYLTYGAAPGFYGTYMRVKRDVQEGAPISEALGNVAQQATYGRPRKLDPQKEFSKRMYLLKDEMFAVQRDIQRDYYFAQADKDKAALVDENTRAWRRKAFEMDQTIQAARALGIPESEIAQSVREMKGVNRRVKHAILNGAQGIMTIEPKQLKDSD